jgi:hypothetical protein
MADKVFRSIREIRAYQWSLAASSIIWFFLKDFFIYAPTLHESTPKTYLTFIEERNKIYKIMPALQRMLAGQTKKRKEKVSQAYSQKGSNTPETPLLPRVQAENSSRILEASTAAENWRL